MSESNSGNPGEMPGVDMGERPSSLSHVPDAMWDTLPTDVRQALRDGAERQAQNHSEQVSRYKAALDERAQAAPQEPEKPRTLADLDDDRLSQVGIGALDKFFGAATANLDEEQAAEFKGVNGAALYGLFEAIAEKTARRVADSAVVGVTSEQARETILAEIDEIAPGAMGNAADPIHIRAGQLLNAQIAELNRIDPVAAQSAAEDPVRIREAFRVAKLETDLTSNRRRTAPAPDANSHQAVSERAQALRRDGRPSDAFDALIQAHVR